MYEKTNETFLSDILMYNTNYDGIGDGDEYHYWQNKLKNVHPDWSNETINATALNYTKNPDVDHDNITDGKEIKGFKNVYRIRIGGYRISYWVNDKIKKVIVLEVKIRGRHIRILNIDFPMS